MSGMAAKLSVKGLEDYARKLVQKGQDIDAIADKAVVEAAQILYDSIAPRVPISADGSHGRPPGTLRAHLVVNGPIVKDNAHFAYAEIDMRDREMMLYAVYVEFGTPHTPAQSYIRTGFNAGKSRASRAMSDLFKSFVEMA